VPTGCTGGGSIIVVGTGDEMNAVVGAVAGVWLGMVFAISFLEAPLRFRAPGVTLALGLGIGRLVFSALNRVEVVLAGVIVLGAAFGPRPAGLVVGGVVAVGALVAQLVVVRPFLVRRSTRVLNGEQGPRSRAHYAYVALEVVKVLALMILMWVALRPV
jgi:hypothetical protein